MLRETILILGNPNTNKKKVNKVIDEIISILSEGKILNECFRETWITQINSYKEVWVMGGDGTLNYFLNFYKNISIPISIFKAGTGNDFSWKLYGNISVRHQVEKVLNAVPKSVDAGICNDKIFINGLGIGFDGEVLRSINTVRFLGGHLGYLMVVIRKIFSFKEYNFEIEIDNTKLYQKYLLLIIANSTRMGGGFMISPTGNINDEKLDLITCDPLTVLERLKYLPVIEKGKHLEKSFINHELITSIKINCEKEMSVQIDGELILGNSFEIKVLPQKYLFKY